MIVSESTARLRRIPTAAVAAPRPRPPRPHPRLPPLADDRVGGIGPRAVLQNSYRHEQGGLPVCSGCQFLGNRRGAWVYSSPWVERQAGGPRD
jgi:hypothetical protein